MAAVKISPKFQIVIPKKIRDAAGLSAGDRVEIINIGRRIEIVPVRPMKEMRGVLSGIKNTFQREDDRCLRYSIRQGGSSI